MKKERLFIGILLIAASVALAVAGGFLLPAEVGMQIGTSGALQNFMPKWLAVALPCAVGTGCAAAYVFIDRKALPAVAAVMIVIQILTIVLN